DHSTRRESHPCMWSVRRWMRTPVHPDGPMSLERLVIPMDRDQPLRVLIALLPRPCIAQGAHGIGCDVAVALVMSQRQTRGVIRQRKQPSRLVDGKPTVVA